MARHRARTEDNTLAARRLLDRKLRSGFQGIVDAAVVEAFDKFTQVIEPGPPYLGPHSVPPEFPHVEAGLLARSIDGKVTGRGVTLQADIGIEDREVGGKNPAEYGKDLRDSGRSGVDTAFVQGTTRITLEFQRKADAQQ